MSYYARFETYPTKHNTPPIIQAKKENENRKKLSFTWTL
jgi:hypothetical protein